MSNNAIKSERQEVVSEEDDLRAQLYEFLATLLRVEPTDAVVKQVANLSGDDTPIGQASSTLAHLAQKMDGTSVRNEYVDLFIGVGRGELLPYCSYYLTGFLNEKPLAKLRQDMAAIGIARADGVKDPEDHIASLCDMMAGLIRGQFSRSFTLAEQASFFKYCLKNTENIFLHKMSSQNFTFHENLVRILRIFSLQNQKS